jgi:hypothetical protein
MREKHLARRTEADLSKGQKSCRQLDLARDFTEPVEAWFWPPDPKERLLQVGTVFRIRIRIHSGQWIRIRIQEGKNDPQK